MDVPWGSALRAINLLPHQVSHLDQRCQLWMRGVRKGRQCKRWVSNLYVSCIVRLLSSLFPFSCKFPQAKWPTRILEELFPGRIVRSTWIQGHSMGCVDAAVSPDALFRTKAVDDGLSKNLYLQLHPSPRILFKRREMPSPGSRLLSWRQLVMKVMNTGPLPQSETTLRGHSSFRDHPCESVRPL